MILLFANGLFFGRFHPLIVHLPIGFLLMAGIFQIAGSIPRLAPLRAATSVALLLGWISALFSVITGYLLSENGDYNEDAVNRHMYMGFITLTVSILAWLITIKKTIFERFNYSAVLLAVTVTVGSLVIFTGHTGGSLTHGSNYLFAGGDSVTKKSIKNKPANKQGPTDEERTTSIEDSAALTAPAVAAAALAKLATSGFSIKIMNAKGNLLDVSLVSPGRNSSTSDRISQLLIIQNNIVWLDISGNQVSDNDLGIVGQFSNLKRLKVANNPITDSGIEKLKGLRKLESLNVYSAKITGKSLVYFNELKNLRTVYAWKTGITDEDIKNRTAGSYRIITGSENTE